MAQVGQAPVTLDDLYREPGKAELIGGKIRKLMAVGRKPNRIAGRIFRSLDEYAEQTGRGEAYTNNMGFTVPLLPAGRESFSPDASYYSGQFPANPMRFIVGPPTLVVAVRSENDYGDFAEAEMAEKRADYFAAGTLVVWDVDTLNDCVQVYRAPNPTEPTTYSRGQIAEADPATPGWQIAVDWIFG
jgi:Uma2 family endonuclease